MTGKTWSAVCVMALALGFASAPADAGVIETIANSQTEFSSTQGLNGWYYGYIANGSSSTYNPATYDPNTHFNPLVYWHSTNNLWQYASSTNTPQVGAVSVHPGTTTTARRLAVRRWVSDVAGVVTIRGTIYRSNTNSSYDGVDGYIWVDGVQIGPTVQQRWNTASYSYDFDVTVAVGSKVDIGIFGRSDLGHDTTTVRLYVDVELPTADPGVPYTVPYMGTLNLNGSASDPGGGTITSYLWNLNNDTVFGDVTGPNPALISYSYLVDTLLLATDTEHTIGLKVIGTTGEHIAYTTLFISSPPPPVSEPAGLGLLGLALLGLKRRRS